MAGTELKANWRKKKSEPRPCCTTVRYQFCSHAMVANVSYAMVTIGSIAGEVMDTASLVAAVAPRYQDFRGVPFLSKGAVSMRSP